MAVNKAYVDKVKEYLESNDKREFSNSLASHAADITEQFLNAAEKSVVIFSGTMHEAFYGDSEQRLFEALGKAAEKIDTAGAIRIITTDAEKDEVVSLMGKITEINDSVGKKVIDYCAAYRLDNTEYEHFLIVDGMRYRIEAPHEPFRGMAIKNVTATVCCNGPKKAREKLEFFDSAWNLMAS